MIKNFQDNIQGYRNSWGVVLFNTSDEPFEVQQGGRIAQAVLNKYEQIEWEEVDSLDETSRGKGGFGSTGVSSQTPPMEEWKVDGPTNFG